MEQTKERKKVLPLVDLEYQPLNSRRISLNTCKKFRYGVAENDRGKPIQVATYGDGGQKWRDQEKNFGWFGEHPKTLFGQELWRQGGTMLVITEGEIDALSVYEACGDIAPVVSVPDGAGSALNVCKKNFDFINSFQKICLCLDNDEPGMKATEELLELFPVGKLYLCKLGHKDANEVLLKQGAKVLRSAILNAQPYRPDGIVDASDIWDAIETPPPVGLSYPWPELTKITFGIRKQEMVIIGAGTGVGKTTVFKQIALHLIRAHKQKVGCLFLEESNRDTVLQMMSMLGERRVHIAGDENDKEVLWSLFDTLTGESKLQLYDSFGAIQFEIIRERIRYMVAVEGCDYIFLDHLTALTDGCGSDSDINQKMRNIVSSLTGMTRELDFGLFGISHLRKAQGVPHEEGGRVHLDDLYGAAALKQWANFVFGIERNQQAEEVAKRNLAYLRCLKDRLTGQGLGSMVGLEYDPYKCILIPAKGGHSDGNPSGSPF